MAWIPAAERLVVYSKLQNGVYIVDPTTGAGELVALEMPLLGDLEVPKERAAFMRARVQVGMVQSFASLGGVILYVVGGTDMFVVFYADGVWQGKRLALGVTVQRIQVLFDSKLLIEDADGQTFSCILQRASAEPEAFFSGLTGVTIRSLTAVTHSEHHDSPLLMEPAIPTPPLITAAFSDNVSATGWTTAVSGSETTMGGFTTGFDDLPTNGIVAAGAEGATWVFPKDESLLPPSDTPTKVLRTWMEQLSAVVTVVSTPNSVTIHVLDYTRNTFYAVGLGPTIGSSPAATPEGELTQDGNQKWQKWCKVVSVTELSDGRLCLLQEDGFIRIFEFAAEALATAEAEWKIMIGAEAGAAGEQRRRQSSGGADDDWGDDDDEEEWEMGVVLRVSESLTYDVQLYSGETVEELSASALDSDDMGPIEVGSNVWVDMQQVEWDDEYDDSDDDDDDDDDSEGQDSQQQGRRGNRKGKGNGRGRGRGRGKGKSGTGGGQRRDGIIVSRTALSCLLSFSRPYNFNAALEQDLNFNMKPGERDAIGDVGVSDGEDAMSLAQQAARDSLAERQKPKELTDRYVSEKEYVDMYDVVGREVATLRVMLEGMEAKEQERVWVKNQIQGEFDDNKL